MALLKLQRKMTVAVTLREIRQRTPDRCPRKQKDLSIPARLGIPAGLNAYFIAVLEFFGGLSHRRPGFATYGTSARGQMFVAYLVADPQALHSVFSDPGKFYNADPYTFLFASVLVIVFGPGLLAIDALLARRQRSNIIVSEAQYFGPSCRTPAL